MTCKNCNNKTSGKYCSRECMREFHAGKQNLGKDEAEFLRKYDKIPTPNELKQYIEGRVGKFTIAD